MAGRSGMDAWFAARGDVGECWWLRRISVRAHYILPHDVPMVAPGAAAHRRRIADPSRSARRARGRRAPGAAWRRQDDPRAARAARGAVAGRTTHRDARA